MRSFVTIAAASLVTLSYALPEPIFGRSPNLAKRDGTCMSQAEAQAVELNFQNTLTNPTGAPVNTTFSVGFHDYSDSVISLIDAGCTGPVAQGSATFDSRAAFDAGQGAQAAIPFELLNLWYNCDTVFFRWRSTIASGAPEFVTGIIVIEAVAGTDSANPWLINTVYSEFNSGAWLVDVGTFVPANCSSSSRRLLRA